MPEKKLKPKVEVFFWCYCPLEEDSVNLRRIVSPGGDRHYF
jgi:hypothetical protein